VGAEDALQQLAQLVELLLVSRLREVAETVSSCDNELFRRVPLLCATIGPANERLVEDAWVVDLAERRSAEAVCNVHGLDRARGRRGAERSDDAVLEVVLQLHRVLTARTSCVADRP